MSVGETRASSRREAAIKAWKTIRAKQLAAARIGNRSIMSFVDETKEIKFGSYVVNPPLVKPSKLTRRSTGGVGKELSDGWAVNFAVGCLFGCRFCYVDAIHKLYSGSRVGDIVNAEWGHYFAVPSNLDEVIEATPWQRWQGKEVLMSSTHDPYLPQLKKWTRKILHKLLTNGVKVCIQTRSPLVLEDLDLLSRYPSQVRLQVSVATMDTNLAKLIEPRVVNPKRRLEILHIAKNHGLRTGVIIAPIIPSCKIRLSVEDDLHAIFEELAFIRPDYVYGESLHVRGVNMAYLFEVLGERVEVGTEFDSVVGKMFNRLLKEYGLTGRFWFGI